MKCYLSLFFLNDVLRWSCASLQFYGGQKDARELPDRECNSESSIFFSCGWLVCCWFFSFQQKDSSYRGEQMFLVKLICWDCKILEYYLLHCLDFCRRWRNSVNRSSETLRPWFSKCCSILLLHTGGSGCPYSSRNYIIELFVFLCQARHCKRENTRP